MNRATQHNPHRTIVEREIEILDRIMNLDNPQEEGKVKSRIKDRTELMSQCSQREDREMTAWLFARPHHFGEEFGY